jgi:flagellar motility protein MotE (MotC chaperone)
MTKILQCKWMIVLIGVVLYGVTTVLLWKPPPRLSGRAVAEASERKLAPWLWDSHEVDQLIAELKKEKESLTQREQQLDELAMRLQTERLELNQVTQMVHQLQMEFDRRVVRIQEEEPANLKKLARMYATMTPEGAMPILKELDDTAIVKIFTYMKETETAPLLEALARQGSNEAKRAAVISERLRVALRDNPPPGK